MLRPNPNRSGKNKLNNKGLSLGVEKLEDRLALAAVPVPEGLVSWWSGDSTAADMTGRNNGVLDGTTFAAGRVADGFNFDSFNDIVLAPTRGFPVGYADRTVELWARIDQFNTDGSSSLFVSYGTPSEDGQALGAYGQVYSLGVKNNGTLYMSTWGPDVRGPVLDVDRWYHLAVTNEGRTARLYVDGSLVALGDVDLATPSNSEFKIGRQRGGNENRLDGQVDEVSVYDRALSAAEIRDIYNAGTGGKVKGNYITADFPSIVETESDVTFTIRRTGSLVGEAVVEWATADGSASSESDYVAASGTITFADSESVKEVLVTVKGDTIPEPDETFQLVVSTATPGYTVLNGYATIASDDPISKFHVVNDGPDVQTDQTYEYQPSGDFVTNRVLQSGNTAPRGAASTAAGNKIWIVDANKKVYVYSSNGNLLGSWTAGGLVGAPQLEGIATNGTDVWLVDAKADKVYKYANAAGLTAGNKNAVSSFSLNKGNKGPKDIVTDGTYLYVVNDSTTDKVFKYTLEGSLVASWTINTSAMYSVLPATSPTGITLDPSNPSSLWIVDSRTGWVYEYADAINQADNSSKWADASFPLAAGNTNPQGIADPGLGMTEISGDFDFDFLVGAADIDRLSEELRRTDRSLRFDLTNDGRVDEADRDRLVREILRTDYGDANLDGLFNSVDMIVGFLGGEYEDEIDGNSTWLEGDWNGDGDFTSSDLVKAFLTGRYEQRLQASTRAMASAVDWIFHQDQPDKRHRPYVA